MMKKRLLVVVGIALGIIFIPYIVGLLLPTWDHEPPTWLIGLFTMMGVFCVAVVAFGIIWMATMVLVIMFMQILLWIQDLVYYIKYGKQ